MGRVGAREDVREIDGVRVVGGDHRGEQCDQRQQHDDAGAGDTEGAQPPEASGPDQPGPRAEGDLAHPVLPSNSMRGSSSAYRTSTTVLVTTKAVTRSNEIAWTTGKSFCETESTRYEPRPLMANAFSTT